MRPTTHIRQRRRVRVPLSVHLLVWERRVRPYVITAMVLVGLIAAAATAHYTWGVVRAAADCTARLAQREELWESAAQETLLVRARLAACESTCPWNAPERSARGRR